MASGKGNNTSIGLLEMIYQAVQSADFVGIMRNDTSPLTNLYVSLHTANPGAAGSQTTSEAAYNNYARIAVARTSGGWTITGESITNAAAITFGLANATGTPETEAYVGVGTALSGAGILLWFGQLTAPLIVNPGITPSIAVGALSITEA
jgi:hypothetical protein